MKLTVAAVTALALTPTLFLLAGDSRAAGPPAQEEATRRISVSSTGSVTVPASYFSIGALLKTNGELTGQALQDLSQTAERMRTAFAQAELEGLETLGQGLKLEYLPQPVQNENNAMRNMIVSSSMNQDFAYGVTCKEPVDLRFTPPEDRAAQEELVVRALDTIVELGLELAEPPSSNNNYMYINGRRVNIGASAVEGELDDEAQAAAEKAAQDKAYKRALELAEQVAATAGARVGAPTSVTVQNLQTTWQGIGSGVEVTATLAVSFELLY